MKSSLYNPHTLKSLKQMDCRPFIKSVARIAIRQLEKIRYSTLTPPVKHLFFVVSCTRNPGKAGLMCLNSVYKQHYDRSKVIHLYLDDDSTDDTYHQTLQWLSTHPNHSVNYIRRNARIGGTFNTLHGMISAPPKSIVIELNGDDWLPDNYTLSFLNKVYAEPSVWMTYNTAKHSSGEIPRIYSPYSQSEIENNSFRNTNQWHCGHLRSFRQELITHLSLQSLIDPITGKLWENSDDRAIYLPFLELSRNHAKHIYRIMCIYNKRPASECFVDPEGQLNRALRIAEMQKYAPLSELTPGDQFQELTGYCSNLL